MAHVIRQLIKNVFTSWMFMAVTVLVAFFFTPYLISQLGKEQYGVWTLVFSLVAYMKLADVGMNQAMARFMSKYLALEDWPQLNAVVSSAARIYAIISIVIVAVSAIIAYGLLQYFQIGTESLATARMTLVVIGLNQAATYMFIPFAALLPFHRADIVNYFEILQLIIQTVAIIVCLELGYGLVAMSAVVLGLNVVSHGIRWAIRRRLFPDVKFVRGSATREKTRQLLAYGSTSLLIVASWIVIFQTDNIVIGRFISMEAIAVFAVPAAIITQLRNSINAIAVPLVPAVSHFEASQDTAEIMKVFWKASRYLFYFSAFVAAGMLTYGGPFIRLWVGPDFSLSVQILAILAVPACLYLPQMVANSVLFGVSKHKILLYILAAEGLANIGLSLLLVKPLGLIGVAIGTAAPQLIIYSAIYPIVFHRSMGASPEGFFWQAARSIVLALALPGAVALAGVLLLEPSDWPTLILGIAAACMAWLAGFYWLVLEPDDRERIDRKLHLRRDTDSPARVKAGHLDGPSSRRTEERQP